ncbi:hypothetical protein PoB_003279200 [Plakobranchus ocellatus]|uniref:Uncharacterized protein n=1 Tax=Plakobranchus ocellatus TaxID=259542 RepID=A0AAV4AGY2_9GAST|nr:hypothetical protein PoB_003279200 [Plakobranchus ocellatus]
MECTQKEKGRGGGGKSRAIHVIQQNNKPITSPIATALTTTKPKGLFGVALQEPPAASSYPPPPGLREENLKDKEKEGQS